MACSVTQGVVDAASRLVGLFPRVEYRIGAPSGEDAAQLWKRTGMRMASAQDADLALQHSERLEPPSVTLAGGQGKLKL